MVVYLACDQRLVGVKAQSVPVLLCLHVDAEVTLCDSGQTVTTQGGNERFCEGVSCLLASWFYITFLN